MEKSSQRQIELANKIAAQQKERSTPQPQAGAPPQAGVQVPAQPPADTTAQKKKPATP
jgi:hypothetical protein